MRVNIIVLIALCSVLVSPSVFSKVINSDATDGLSYCSKILNGEKRLACYDELAKKYFVSVKLDEPDTHQVVQAKAPVTKVKNIIAEEKQKIDEFSKEDIIKKDEEKELESITSTVTSIKKLIRGELVIDLENGQQWRQKDSARISLKVGDEVILKKGALGAVYFYKVGSNRRIKVKRLK